MKSVHGGISKLRWLSRIAVCVVVASIVGCGGGAETGSIQGTVTLGDKPFGPAELIFVSLESGQGGSTELTADGTFNLETEIPVGTYTVYLAPKVDEEEMMKRMQQGLPTKASMDKKLPKKYLNEVSSDLTVSVQPGPNDVTLTMNTK